MPAPVIGSLNFEPPLPLYCSSAPDATEIGVVALVLKMPLPIRSAPPLTVTVPPAPKVAALPDKSSRPAPAFTSAPVVVPVIVATKVEFQLFVVSPTVSVSPVADVERGVVAVSVETREGLVRADRQDRIRRLALDTREPEGRPVIEEIRRAQLQRAGIGR